MNKKVALFLLILGFLSLLATGCVGETKYEQRINDYVSSHFNYTSYKFGKKFSCLEYSDYMIDGSKLMRNKKGCDVYQYTVTNDKLLYHVYVKDDNGNIAITDDSKYVNLYKNYIDEFFANKEYKYSKVYHDVQNEHDYFQKEYFNNHVKVELNYNLGSEYKKELFYKEIISENIANIMGKGSFITFVFKDGYEINFEKSYNGIYIEVMRDDDDVLSDYMISTRDSFVSYFEKYEKTAQGSKGFGNFVLSYILIGYFALLGIIIFVVVMVLVNKKKRKKIG